MYIYQHFWLLNNYDVATWLDILSESYVVLIEGHFIGILRGSSRKGNYIERHFIGILRKGIGSRYLPWKNITWFFWKKGNDLEGHFGWASAGELGPVVLQSCLLGPHAHRLLEACGGLTHLDHFLPHLYNNDNQSITMSINTGKASPTSIIFSRTCIIMIINQSSSQLTRGRPHPPQSSSPAPV